MPTPFNEHYSVLQRGKLISFTLLDASGKVSYTQPVWAQWDYNVSSLLGMPSVWTHTFLRNSALVVSRSCTCAH